MLGSLVYDIENGSRVSHSLGLAYSDECLDLSAVYSETPDQYSDLVTSREFFVRVSLRTLTDDSAAADLGSAIP
jgi:lipopolysaccharide assembly outer membrane protein LptD (OstA)